MSGIVAQSRAQTLWIQLVAVRINSKVSDGLIEEGSYFKVLATSIKK